MSSKTVVVLGRYSLEKVYFLHTEGNSAVLLLLYVHSAMDIKELKILEIRNGSNGVTKRSVPESGSSVTGYTGRKDKGGGNGVNIAPVNVPKAEPRLHDGGVSPSQHYSKSYVERHVEIAGQSKGFRRRHNSCKYTRIGSTEQPRIACNEMFLFFCGTMVQHCKT